MKEIKDLLNALQESANNEQIALYKKIIESSSIPAFDGAEEFFFAVLYPFEKFVNGMIKASISKNSDVEFIYKNFKFIERLYLKIIVDEEGSACSADKSRTIVRRLVDFFENGKEIVFDYEGEYTYHLPKKVFTTHNEIVSMYQAIKRLYCGDPTDYITTLNLIR